MVDPWQLRGVRSSWRAAIGATALIAAVALVTSACGERSPRPASPPPAVAGSPEVPPQALERARATARAVGGELSARLFAELRQGPAENALRVCSEVAQELAASHSGEGLSVRRVSRSYRNAANAPDAWEAERLAELEAAHAEGGLPPERIEVVGEGGDRRLRYLKSLVVLEPCLACHGAAETLDPGVRDALHERYPEDRATGYREGDFRGAISVVVEIG